METKKPVVETQPERKSLKDIRVAILTPYLYESIEQMFARAPSPEWALSQIYQFGQAPNNLAGLKTITTQNYRVELIDPNPSNEESKSHLECLLDPKVIFSIAGSAPKAEERILSLKNNGLIVARYSIFYGGPSKYSGRSAAESGYALDIPKDVETVRKLLTADSVLESLAARDEKATEESFRVMNQGLSNPVLVTPFLHETLQNEKSGGYQQ